MNNEIVCDIVISLYNLQRRDKQICIETAAIRLHIFTDYQPTDFYLNFTDKCINNH